MGKLQLNLVDIKNKLWKSKGLFIIVFVSLSLLGASVFSVNETEANKNKEVLGASSKKVVVNTNPTKPISTTPTLAPKLIPSITFVQKISLTPTPVPSNNSSSAVTPAPTSVPNISTAPIVTLTSSPSPIPAGLSVQIGVDYSGQKSSDSYNVALIPDQTAWEAVVAAIGADNIKYTDYGGDMGKFITSFNGVDAAANQFYEFRINGASASTGVSSYKCNNNDKLEFVLTSF
ncbi:MAG: DUF4430 domain-containing protein [Candidatus Levybacteria bacterium]|nr:DUF4430 domain-containing protein [Candidatus Levybacteria bacterium]